MYRICREFEAIKERALKVPETTEEMVETIDYIKKVKTKGIQDLLLRIKVNDYPLILNLLPNMLAYTNTEFVLERSLLSDHAACMNKLYPQCYFRQKWEVQLILCHMPFLLIPHSYEFCMSVRKRSF